MRTRFLEYGWETFGLGRRELGLANYLSHDLSLPIPAHCQTPCDVVIHCAARSNPWGTKRQYHADNVVATQNIIDYCKQTGLPKLIYISSSSVYYRQQHQFNITEETPLPEAFVNQYAATKRAGELLVEKYPGDWAILRPRAVFGPGDTVLLPRILHAARQGRLPLLVSPDGPVMGDLIYISNLVDCVERVAEEQRVRGYLNLTNDEPVPLHEFLFRVFDQLGVNRPQRIVSTRTAYRVAWGLELFHRLFLPQHEPAITRFGVHVFQYSKTFDVSKMKGLLGSPKVDLQSATEQTVNWYRETLQRESNS